jgi:hypothetical protein
MDNMVIVAEMGTRPFGEKSRSASTTSAKETNHVRVANERMGNGTHGSDNSADSTH